ncbi:hypothetical protein RJT34_17004 [Clitoria ternatea]|uniref:Uncharacterized protein n=1 Tax=Clitoria ternatea TaxID=43366 RepID=A0AAN9J9S0_CLITE
MAHESSPAENSMLVSDYRSLYFLRRGCYRLPCLFGGGGDDQGRAMLPREASELHSDGFFHGRIGGIAGGDVTTCGRDGDRRVDALRFDPQLHLRQVLQHHRAFSSLRFQEFLDGYSHCVYSIYDGPTFSHGPYLGTVTLCSFLSIVLLSVKACLFTANSQIEVEASVSLKRQKLHLKKSWGMLVLFLSSVVFALGHTVVAYRTRCRARRKLLFHRVNPEAVISSKNVFSGYPKVPRSPTPSGGEPPKVTMKQDADLLGQLVMKNFWSNYLWIQIAYSSHFKV